MALRAVMPTGSRQGICPESSPRAQSHSAVRYLRGARPRHPYGSEVYDALARTLSSVVYNSTLYQWGIPLTKAPKVRNPRTEKLAGTRRSAATKSSRACTSRSTSFPRTPSGPVRCCQTLGEELAWGSERQVRGRRFPTNSDRTLRGRVEYRVREPGDPEEITATALTALRSSRSPFRYPDPRGRQGRRRGALRRR